MSGETDSIQLSEDQEQRAARLQHLIKPEAKGYIAINKNIWYALAQSEQHPGYWHVAKVYMELSLADVTGRPVPQEVVGYYFELFGVPDDLDWQENDVARLVIKTAQRGKELPFDWRPARRRQP
jgi:hypothetical protein